MVFTHTKSMQYPRSLFKADDKRTLCEDASALEKYLSEEIYEPE